MCHKLFADASLASLLLAIDRELAAAFRAEGCRCGGALHTADYPRKPRSSFREVPSGFELRLSFCCATDGCRKRSTPPSMRFLGRRVYAGAIVVLLSALSQGLTPVRVRRLRELVGVSRRTLDRWRTWWRDSFPASRFFRSETGFLQRPVNPADLPNALLSRFVAEDDRSRLLSVLRFLLPITTTTGSTGRAL